MSLRERRINDGKKLHARSSKSTGRGGSDDVFITELEVEK